MYVCASVLKFMNAHICVNVYVPELCRFKHKPMYQMTYTRI